jgi:three-Cys-motif partner protein
MKPVEYYKGREQTYLKHLFLEQYLETLIYHIGFFQPEFVFVDCFSGPWRAADEQLGDTSIRIALERLNAAIEGLAKNGRHPVVRAIFVEKSQAAFATLQRVLQEHSGAVKTLAIPGSFEDNIGTILNQIGSTFTFLFVDPTGWTGFAMDKLRPILQRAKGEVMINFMFDFINRFLSVQTTANEESLDLFFGTPQWRELRNTPDREAALVSLYAEQVRTAGKFLYATFTRILKPHDDRAYFHLVYATRNAKGIEKFRDVEKKVVAQQELVRERAQRERREERSGQGELFFEANTPSKRLEEDRHLQLRKAEALLAAILKSGSSRFEDLQPRILELPLVWTSDLTTMLLEGCRSGHLAIEGLRPRERTPKPGHIVRLHKRG